MKRNYKLEKEQKLGMSFSAAHSRLKRDIIFHLLKQIDKDACFRCGKKIETAADLSIDHKEGWLYSDNPSSVFFDMNNIAFSHIGCNSTAKKCPRNTWNKTGYKGVYSTGDRFRARIGHKVSGQYKIKHLGTFDSIEEAAKAYDLASKELHKDKAVTNEDLGLLP